MDIKKQNDQKARENLKKLIEADEKEKIATITGDGFTKEEKIQFLRFIRRTNFERSRSGRPRLQYSYKMIDGEIHYSRPSTASISS